MSQSTNTSDLINNENTDREYSRRLHFTKIEYSINGRTYSDFTRDISNRGIFIITHYKHSVGHQISAVYKRPNEETYTLSTGKIVRTTSQGFGVKFKHVYNFDKKYPDDFNKSSMNWN